MAFLHQFWEELQEERYEQQTDMHAIDIGIGGHNHLIISQTVETLLNVEGCLQEIELLVLIDHLLGELEGVKRLTTQREDGLRYNKVIVATDADVDGMHIRLLMITFFLQFFPELIKKGHVYILQTPLFRVRQRRKKLPKARLEAIGEADSKGDFITRYCYSEEERLQNIEALGPEPEITRFKGLGEISPDEFRGFIGEDIRLEQVSLHKSDQVAELLEYYMGKNTMERQNFIIDNLVIEEDRPEDEEEEVHEYKETLDTPTA